MMNPPRTNMIKRANEPKVLATIRLRPTAAIKRKRPKDI